MKVLVDTTTNRKVDNDKMKCLIDSKGTTTCANGKDREATTLLDRENEHKAMEKYRWTKDFLPLLKLVWPLVDFSDENVVMMQLVVLEGGIDGRYQDPRALMDFFHRRGIVNLEALSIFRRDDFTEADDVDCKSMFKLPRFLDILDRICYFITVKGGNALTQIVGRKSNNCCNGLCEIEQVSKNREEAHSRLFGGPAFGAPAFGGMFGGPQAQAPQAPAFFGGFGGFQDLNLPEFGRTQGGDNIKLMTLQRAKEIMEIEILEPNTHFKVQPKFWTLDGFLTLMSSLGENQTKSHLQSLTMTIPVCLVAASTKARDSLTSLLRGKGDNLIDFCFEFDDKVSGICGSIGILPRFPDAYKTCLHAMIEGFTSSGVKIEQLTLQKMDLGSIENDYDNRGIHNPMDVIFEYDNIRQLHVAWSVDGKLVSNDLFKYFLGLKPTSDDHHITRLNLYDMVIGAFCWEAMWNRISSLTQLEVVVLDPRPLPYRLNATQIYEAVTSMSCLPNLKILCLGDHGTGIDITVDLTPTLSALLDKGVIEQIAIIGHPSQINTGLREVPQCYRMNSKLLCDCLKENKSLRNLALIMIKVADLPSETSLAHQLLDVLRHGNNTSLQQVNICDKKYVYTGTGFDSWISCVSCVHDLVTYQNYEDTLQLEYATKLNRFGLGKIREQQETSAESLVNLLSEAFERFFMSFDTEMVVFRQQLVAMNDNGSNHCVDELYHKLRHEANISLWCQAYENEVEYVGILFGLLREKPDIWCNLVDSH